MNGNNKLQRNVAPLTVTKMSELRKMFEQKHVEDNHIDRKTAPRIRKTTSARKTFLKQEDTEPQQQWVQEDQEDTSTSFRRKFMFRIDDNSRKQPDIFVPLIPTVFHKLLP